MDKKIAVHVKNEEEWNEVKEYYQVRYLAFKDGKIDYPNDELALDSEGRWSSLKCYKNDLPEYEILEFNEWKERVKGDNMEKIEVPQAVYDEFIILSRKFETVYSVLYRVWGEGKFYNNLHNYIFSGDEIKLHQLNIAKVMAGEAEFVPVEEAYYWQDIQGLWLVYDYSRKIETYIYD